MSQMKVRGFDREFKKLWAMLDRNAREFDRRMKKEEAARKKSTEDFDRRTEEFDRRMKKADERYGGFISNYADSLEEDFFRAMRDGQCIGDMALEDTQRNIRGNINNYEFDIVGTNGDFVLVCEIKHKLTVDNIARFAEQRLPYFARECPFFARERKVLGMVGGKLADEAAAAEAKRRGLILLRLEHRKLIAEHVGEAREVAQQASPGA